MNWLCIILALFGISALGCNTISKPDLVKPVMATLQWKAGMCADHFIVYQEQDGMWKYVDETVATRYRFELKQKEVKVLSVSGICMHGPDEGEWMSMEEVIAKR